MTHQDFKVVRAIPQFLIVLVLATLLAACGGKEDDQDSGAPAAEKTPATITLMLGLPQIKYAGVYAAVSHGYFTDENLTVELQYSTPTDGSDPTVDFSSPFPVGEPIFGVLPAEMLLQMRQAGNDIMAVLTLIQRDSRGIISTTDNPINTPADLVGKRLLILPGTADITNIFLTTVGIDPNDITMVDGGNAGVATLVSQIVSGEVDGFVFSIEGEAQLNGLGLQTNRLAFYDYGVLSYHNIFYTSREMIELHPDVVQRFVNALLRGMQYSIDHPDEIAAQFVEDYADVIHPLQVSVQDEGMRSIIPLMQTATSKPGMMDAATWEYLIHTLSQLGLVDASMKADDAYTLRFVEAYYK
ncbi:MAG: ABC transporter substrate-binding protein [Anaerolineae bacterium]|nr:ABC transporter substrate-binding protein [Anaerolineae bacterium]